MLFLETWRPLIFIKCGLNKIAEKPQNNLCYSVVLVAVEKDSVFIL